MKREIDKDGLLLCSIQSRIFELSPIEYSTSSPVFIRRFMNSALACEMDSPGFLDYSFEAADAFARIDDEYGRSKYGKEKYPSEVMYWIGYIYRYWAYTCQMSSRQIYNIIGAREINSLYYAYHTLDPAAAIERIMEAKGQKSFEDVDMCDAVALMRKVRNVYNKNGQ